MLAMVKGPIKLLAPIVIVIIWLTTDLNEDVEEVIRSIAISLFPLEILIFSKVSHHFPKAVVLFPPIVITNLMIVYGFYWMRI